MTLSRQALAAIVVVVVLGGCASWPFRPAAMLLMRADRARDELRFRQALALYDDFLARYPDDPEAAHAVESRNTVAAIVTTRDELTRLRSELRARESEAAKAREEAAKSREETARLRDEVAKLRDEVARVRQELSTRQAESDKLRADLERMKELDLRLERRR